MYLLYWYVNEVSTLLLMYIFNKLTQSVSSNFNSLRLNHNSAIRSSGYLYFNQ
jgi:hypothetical protein